MEEKDHLAHLLMTQRLRIPNYFLVSSSVEHGHVLMQAVPPFPRREQRLSLTLLHSLMLHQWTPPPCLNFDAGHVMEVAVKGATEIQMMEEKLLHEHGCHFEALSCQFDPGVQASCGSRWGLMNLDFTGNLPRDGIVFIWCTGRQSRQSVVTATRTSRNC
jgi:hypothetical protein